MCADFRRLLSQTSITHITLTFRSTSENSTSARGHTTSERAGRLITASAYQARHLSIIIPCCCTTTTSLGKSCLRLSDLCVAKWHRIVRKLLLFRCLGSDVNSDDTRFVALVTCCSLVRRMHPFFVVVDRPRTLWRPMRDWPGVLSRARCCSCFH